MSDEGRKWIVRDGEGRIYGPYATSKVLRQIEKGYFSGGEMIASYPDGDWIAISKAPEFYDKLLDVIASEGERPQKGTRSGNAKSRSNAEGTDDQHVEPASEVPRQRGRVIRDAETRSGSSGPSTAGNHVPRPPFPIPGENTSTKTVDRISKATEAGNVIELTDLKALERTEKARTAKLPLLLIAAAFVLVLVALLVEPEQREERFRLLRPRKNQPAISAQEASAKLKQARLAFQSDTVSDYMRAQSLLVSVVEGSPRDLVAWGHLCLVYRELWPYSAQDPRDIATVREAMLEAKNIERAGLLAGVCEVSFLINVGKFTQARNLTESLLSIPGINTRAPVLYEIQSDFVYESGDFLVARNYAAQARQLWPQWLKPYMTEARALIRLKEFPKAKQLLVTILNSNPRHQVARAQLGTLEYHQFRQIDKAFELVKAALDSGEKLPRALEVDASLVMAQIYEQRKDGKRALEYAKRAFMLNTNHPLAREIVQRLGGDSALKDRRSGREALYLGDQYVRVGDCIAAQAEYKAAFETDPSNAVAATKAAKCLWQLSQSKEAIEWLQKAIKADPKYIEAYTVLADYYSQRFEHLLAMRTLQKVQQMAPRNFEVYRGFALVELRRNNFSQAIKSALKAKELYDADAETQAILAQALAGGGQPVEAERAILRAIELDETNVESQAFYVKIVHELRGIETALERVNKLILDYPQIAEFRLAKGEILLKEEKYVDAVFAFREVLSLDKRNKKALLLMGRSQLAQADPQEALKSYLAAAELDPADANPLFLAGELYAAEGKFEDSKRMFERVLKINPGFPRAHYNLGLAYLKLKSPQEALQEAESERGINPKLAEAYVLSAEAYYSLEQYSNCAAQYQKAVALRPADSGIYVKMARCYRLSGALDSASSLLKQAHQIESGNPDVWKEMGATYHLRGMASESIEAYRKYLGLVPNAEDRAEVEAAIRQVESGASGSN